jgi:hypothetical protein
VTRAAWVALVASLAAVEARAQQPPIQNGRVEARPSADLARDIDAVASRATEPVWVGWRVPIAGVRTLCSWYVDDTMAVRGFLAAVDETAPAIPQIAPPEGPVPIEAGTGLVVLARLASGRVERLRTLTDDCPIDAGGRTLHWLDGVSAARSLAYLDRLAQLGGTDGLDRQAYAARRTLAAAAVSAMGLHADPGVPAALLAVLAREPDAALKRRVVHGLAGLPGNAGVPHLIALARTSTDQVVRREAVTRLGETKDPRAVAYLAGILSGR